MRNKVNIFHFAQGQREITSLWVMQEYISLDKEAFKETFPKKSGDTDASGLMPEHTHAMLSTAI